MKSTESQALAVYDSFFGTLRCFNGGTHEENIRMAPRCRELLEGDVRLAAQLAANPNKVLAADVWYMTALRETIPQRFELFNSRYFGS